MQGMKKTVFKRSPGERGAKKKKGGVEKPNEEITCTKSHLPDRGTKIPRKRGEDKFVLFP